MGHNFYKLEVCPMTWMVIPFFYLFFSLAQKKREERNKEEESRKSVGARELLLEEK